MLHYRRLAFGGLAEFNVLDTRQYRTAQPCGAYKDYKNAARCPQALDPSATMLGAVQERWLLEGLGRSRARWNVMAQQVPMMQRIKPRGGEALFNMDKWDGYPLARKTLLDTFANKRPSNAIVLSGDVHANWVGDLLADFDNPDSAIVGAEFVGTSISSGGDGADTTSRGLRIVDANEHLKFYNRQRGYVRCTVTEDRWQADWRVVPFVTRPGAAISTRASFVVENGVPGVESA